MFFQSIRAPVCSPTNRTRQGPSWSCTALASLSSSTGRGCQGKSRHSGSFSTSTRPCRVITWPSASSTISVGIPGGGEQMERGWHKQKTNRGGGGNGQECGSFPPIIASWCRRFPSPAEVFFARWRFLLPSQLVSPFDRIYWKNLLLYTVVIITFPSLCKSSHQKKALLAMSQWAAHVDWGLQKWTACI